MGKLCKRHSHLKNEVLEKGALKTAAATIGAVASIAAGHNAKAPAQHGSPKAPTHQTQSPKSNYDHKRMLRSIASVESNNGKNINHKEVKHGLNAHSKAYGKYAVMPITARETINMHPDLKQKHGKAIALGDKELSNYMHDNPGLDEAIADRHLTRLEGHFGQNRENISHAWNAGITSTKRAIKSNKDISQNPYVKRVINAYGK